MCRSGLWPELAYFFFREKKTRILNLPVVACHMQLQGFVFRYSDTEGMLRSSVIWSRDGVH